MKPPSAKSEGEANLEALIRWERLPPAQREYTFHLGRRWRFDFAWPAQMVALEVEGGSFTGGHKRGKAYESDCEKQNEAMLDGWKVFRVTPAMVLDGRATALIRRAVIPQEIEAQTP